MYCLFFTTNSMNYPHTMLTKVTSDISKAGISLILLTILAFTGCKTSSVPTKPSDDGNSVEFIGDDDADGYSASQSKIIFNGKNNKIIFDYLDSYFSRNDGGTIMIIEGDGNTIRISNRNMASSGDRIDTLIITANESYVGLLNSFMDHKSAKGQTVRLDFENNYRISDMADVIDTTYNEDSLTTQNKLTGEWVPVKEIYNIYLYRAINNDLRSQVYLAELFETGMGVPRDLKKAEQYYLLAAKRGFADAQAGLGNLYEMNDQYSTEKSIEWYEKAAKQGHAYAIERLKVLRR